MGRGDTDSARRRGDGRTALRRGEQIHRGLIAEFIGDAHKSASIGLPVYSIGGGPGCLWGASFDDAGNGSLRISAVDASALGPAQPPPVAVAPSPSTPSPEIVPAPPPQQPDQAAPTPNAPTPNAPTEKPALKTMDVIDSLVDRKSLIGQTVTVTGCLLQQAGDRIVVCSAGSQGSFFIDGNTLAREDLRRALRECAGFDGDECRVAVTGNVSGDAFGAELTNAAMKWAATLAAPQSPPVAENETSEAMPAKEKAVIDAVEQARYPADRLVRIPDAVSDAQAAASFLRGVTARMLLKEVVPLQRERHGSLPCRGGRGRAPVRAMGAGARRSRHWHGVERGEGRGSAAGRLRRSHRLHERGLCNPRA